LNTNSHDDNYSENAEYKQYIQSIYKYNIAALVISWVIWSPLSSMYRPYYQVYAKELGATPFILSLIAFSSIITMGVSKLAGGYVADKHGRKKIIVYLTFAVASSYLIFAFAPDWRCLIIGEVLGGIAILYQPALAGLMYDSTPKEKRGKIFGVYNFIPSALAAVSPLFAVYLVSQYSVVPAVRLIFLLMFVGGIFVGLIRATLLRETLVEEMRDQARNISFGHAYKEAIHFIKERYLHVLLVAVLINTATTLSFLVTYYSIYFLKIDYVTWGVIWIIGSIAGVIITIPMGFLVDRIGRRPTLLLSISLLAWAYFLYFSAPYSLLLISVVYVVAMAEIFRNIANYSFSVVYPSLTTDIVPPELRGRVSSVSSLLINLIASAISLIAGIIYMELGANIPFLLSTIILLVTFILATLTVSETK